MLQQNPNSDLLIASLDEVGRGCFAGPVVAACVIWKEGPLDHLINDSKKLTANKRQYLADYIKENAIDYSISFIDANQIDQINILNATYKAMHECLDKLSLDFDEILVDGDKFKKYKEKKHTCVIKGDSKYVSIAAASILAKVARDEYMYKMSTKYPSYKWHSNVGYGTRDHIEAILRDGVTPYHRMSFLKNLLN